MIEIKHVDGRVLYTAKGAADVRAAVTEAVGNRAYLSGAYLSGAYLSGAYLSGADLSGADLSGADLSGANLSGADLYRADLYRADLYRADLSGANLSGAYLYRAYLSGANLSGAVGVNPLLTSPLHMLTDQVGKIRAYKLVDAEGRSPIQSSGKITYRKGETVEAKADTDPAVECGAGVNVASLDWCLREWKSGWRVLVVEFTAKDIAAIPHGTDGKFRVHRCKVVGEKSLSELGLDDGTPQQVETRDE